MQEAMKGLVKLAPPEGLDEYQKDAIRVVRPESRLFPNRPCFAIVFRGLVSRCDGVRMRGCDALMASRHSRTGRGHFNSKRRQKNDGKKKKNIAKPKPNQKRRAYGVSDKPRALPDDTRGRGWMCLLAKKTKCNRWRKRRRRDAVSDNILAAGCGSMVAGSDQRSGGLDGAGR